MKRGTVKLYHATQKIAEKIKGDKNEEPPKPAPVTTTTVRHQGYIERGTTKEQLTQQQALERKLQEAVELGKRAVALDEQQHVEEAFHAYMTTLDFLVPILKEIKDENTKKMVKEQVLIYMNRSEQLKPLMNQPASRERRASSSTSSSAPQFPPTPALPPTMTFPEIPKEPSFSGNASVPAIPDFPLVPDFPNVPREENDTIPAFPSVPNTFVNNDPSQQKPSSDTLVFPETPKGFEPQTGSAPSSEQDDDFFDAELEERKFNLAKRQQELQQKRMILKQERASLQEKRRVIEEEYA